VIHLTGTTHSPGTIIVAAGVQPRYYEFQTSLDGVYAPVGTKLIIERSCDITQNFNKGIKAMTGEWAWFLGDDHWFAPGTLMKFLSYNVDVVVPITPCKTAPWLPCVIHGPGPGKPMWEEDMLLYRWEELSGEGLLALPQGDFIGQAGMLVRKSVLDTLGYPWFKCGQFDHGRLQEDIKFCSDLQQLGYTVWVDQSVIFDHYMVMGITARRHEGKYAPALKSGLMTVVLPDAAVPRGTTMPRMLWSTVPPPERSNEYDPSDGAGARVSQAG